MKRLLCLLVLLAQDAPKDALYPLKVGTVWTYVSNGVEGKITVMGREKIGEIEATVLQSENPDRPAQKEYVVADDKEIRLLRLVVGDHTDDYTPPITRFKLPGKTGETWEWKGEIGKDKASVTFKNEGEEDIKVPAGTYKAWKVTIAMDFAGTKSSGANWYAPGVGVVRQVRTAEGDGKKVEGVIELKSVQFPK